MSPLILSMNVSLDGFVATPEGDNSFIFPQFDDELRDLMLEELWAADLHAMGRVTYEAMSAHWPVSDEPYAAPMNEKPKLVFSRSLEQAGWGPVGIARGDLEEEVGRLGGNVLVHGGSALPQSLIRLGLVDEYRLIVHPVALGAGMPLFGSRADLRLRSSRAFPAGAVALRFGPATP